MKKYVSPDIEIIETTACDIIKTSDGTEGPVIDMDHDSIFPLDH